MEGDVRREIAGYRIESEIGRGGMGVVYLATQAFPERRVAIKLLSPDLATDPSFRERFIRESNAAASTEHPNIVPVYGAGEADGHLYLAMRFIEGTDLRTLLEREGPLEPERATRICAQVADALEAAHERGLVHRDVKPGNVLLDVRDRAYLTDFGLIRRARMDTGLTKTGQFMGTVDYVAPEQIRGETLDGRADDYSLGCVLYESLVGSPPFHRESEVATLYAHLEDEPPRMSAERHDLPVAADDVIARALAKRKEDRFPSGATMVAAARSALTASTTKPITAATIPASPPQGGEMPVTPPGALVPDGTPRRGRWWIGLVAAAVIAVIAVVAAFNVVRDDRTAESPPSSPSPTVTPIPLNSVAQMDVNSGEILRSSEGLSAGFGNELPEVDFGEGGVWVLRGQNLTHLDPADASTVGTVTIEFGGGSLDVGLRTVWVGAPPGVVRIDPIDDEHLRPVRLPDTGIFLASEVTIGASSAWVAQENGELSRVEGSTGRIIESVDVGPSVTGIAFGFESVWVIDELEGTLTRVDAADMVVDDPVVVTGDLDDIAAGAGAVWLLDSEAGVVTPFDPIAGQLDSPIRVGLEPTDLAVGLDAVWVANHGEGTISRIDPVTRQVETITIGSPVAAITVDESTDSLWIVIADRPSGG